MPESIDMLKELKKYLRIDHDEDDAQLNILMDAAVNYLSNAGAVDDGSPLYRLAIWLYAGMFYENRDGAQPNAGLSPALQSIVLQLKAATPKIPDEEPLDDPPADPYDLNGDFP